MLLAQQSLDQFGLGEVARVGNLDKVHAVRSDRDLPDLHLTDGAFLDQIGADLGLRRVGEPDDDPLDAGPVGREVDVGLRRVGGGMGVGVVDRA